MGLTAPLIAANARRVAEGAALTVTATRGALDALGPLIAEVPRHLVAAARLRVAHPDDSLTELAARHDPPLTKDAYAGRLRRFISLASPAA